MKITLIIPDLQLWDFFQRTQEWVRNSRGKRAISVRATKGLLYISPQVDDFKDLENAAPICPASTDHNGDVATVSGWGTTSEGNPVIL